MKILKTVDVNLVNKYRKELFGIASCMIVFIISQSRETEIL